MIRILHFILTSFHSRNRVALLLLGTTLVTAGLAVLMIGLIQDFMGNEFNDFNEVTRVINFVDFYDRMGGSYGCILLFGIKNGSSCTYPFCIMLDWMERA